MRILHLLASPYWSGPAENVALLAHAQRTLGHDVRVAIDLRRIDAPAEELARPRLEALDLLDRSGLELSVKSSPARIWADIRALRSSSFDVVHTHFSHDHFIARWGLPKGARLVRSIHAPRSIRWSLPRADAYTVPTTDDTRRLLGQRVGVLPALVGDDFVPSRDRAELRRELGLDGQPIIGMVSTFQPSRRHDAGVEAFRLVRQRSPDARLVLVGDGGTLPLIRQQVEQAGLASAVVFAGYQSGAAFVPWLQALDVVWILGLGNDWSARAAAQARACDVRVVAVDEGALSSFADEIVAADPAEIASATARSDLALSVRQTNVEIAEAVLRLYATSRPS